MFEHKISTYIRKRCEESQQCWPNAKLTLEWWKIHQEFYTTLRFSQMTLVMQYQFKNFSSLKSTFEPYILKTFYY